jgi:WD40 repeat protein
VALKRRIVMLARNVNCMGLAAACLVLTLLGHLPAPAGDKKAADLPAAAQEKPRTDRYGDPLPERALARLGTMRWHQASAPTYVAFTADSKRLLTASEDRVIRLWDVSTGKEIRRFEGKQVTMPKADRIVADEMAVLAYAFGGGYSVALAPDGKAVAAAGSDNVIHLWETATGKATRQIKGPPGGLTTLVFSPDGKTLAARAGDQAIHLWESATGKEIRHIKGQQFPTNGPGFAVPGGLGGLVFSPDGKLLAGSEIAIANRRQSAAVKLWEADSGKVSQAIPVREPYGVSSLTFSADGKVLAYGGGNTIHLVEVASGKEIRRIQGPQTGVPALAFSADGKIIAAKTFNDPAIHLYDVATGKVVRQLGGARLPAGQQMVVATSWNNRSFAQDLAWSPDGKLIAAGGGHGLRVWEAATGKDYPLDWAGHHDDITAVAITPDGALVASQGADGTVRLWEKARGKERHRFQTPRGTTCAAFTADGRTVALGTADGKVRLHETATGEEVCRLIGHQNGVVAVAFSPDGKTVASRGAYDHIIQLYDTATGKIRRQITLQPQRNAEAALIGFAGQGGYTGPGMNLVFSPGGKTLASPVAGSNNLPRPPPTSAAPPGTPDTLTLWDVASGRVVRRIELPAQYSIKGFAFAPDGRTVATANTDQTITLWEVASGKERARLARVGRLPVSVNNIPVFSMPRILAGHLRAAEATIVFAPDGRSLAMCGPDQSIRVWDVAAGKEIGELKGHGGKVTTLAMSADGNTLVSGSTDTTILVWDLGRLRPAPKVRIGSLQAKAVQALWAELANADAAKAYQAIQKLATAPEQVVPLLRERLRPADPVEARKIEQWVADLDSPKFRLRQQATTELEKLGELAVPALAKVLASRPRLETQRRVELLLDKAAARTFTAEQLRLVRALEVLELLATTEARQVLMTLSGGAAAALPTREAQAALDRLGRRSPASP